jgi:hypothetical protein
MRHDRPQLGTICQAEDLNTVLMEARGEGIARALADKLLVHLGKAADHPIGVRRLDGSYLESTLGRLLPLLAPADLGSCLGEHPGKAFELLCGHLILHQAAAIAQRDHDRPAAKSTSAVHPTPIGPLDAASLEARLACPGTAHAARKCMPIETPTGKVRAVIVADMVEILDKAQVSRGYAEIYDLKRAGYPDDTCSTLGPEAAKLLAKRVADRLEAEARDNMEVA